MLLLLEILACILASVFSGYWEWRAQKTIPDHIKNEPDDLNEWRMTRFNTFVIMPPIVEELIFRAVLVFFFDNLNGYSISAVLLIALIFAAVHNTPREHRAVEWRWQNIGAITRRVYLQFTGGVIMGVVAIWSQSLLAAVGIHMLWNFSVWLRLQYTLIEDEDVEFSQLYVLMNKLSTMRRK